MAAFYCMKIYLNKVDLLEKLHRGNNCRIQQIGKNPDASQQCAGEPAGKERSGAGVGRELCSPE